VPKLEWLTQNAAAGRNRGFEGAREEADVDIADAVGRPYAAAAGAKRERAKESVLCEMGFADLV
jgi:hypothetical protein